MRHRLDRKDPVDYQIERSNEKWPDHVLRTQVTAACLAWLHSDSVIDPACGDGSIVLAAHAIHPIAIAVLSDISHPNVNRLNEKLERSDYLNWIAVQRDVADALKDENEADTIVLTEILEHVEDPDYLLRRARDISSYLIASSPEMRPGQIDGNPEHLWMFDKDGYEQMLVAAGWTVQQYTFLQFTSEYDFGIWVCS